MRQWSHLRREQNGAQGHSAMIGRVSKRDYFILKMLCAMFTFLLIIPSSHQNVIDIRHGT